MESRNIVASGEELTIDILIKLLQELPKNAVVIEACMTMQEVHIQYQLQEEM